MSEGGGPTHQLLPCPPELGDDVDVAPPATALLQKPVYQPWILFKPSALPGQALSQTPAVPLLKAVNLLSEQKQES